MYLYVGKVMPVSIVLSGAESDAEEAAEWAMREALKAKYSDIEAADFSRNVERSFRDACDAFFSDEGARQMMMLSLDFAESQPRIEFICDGALARGVVKGAARLEGAKRRRDHAVVDGTTCVSLPA